MKHLYGYLATGIACLAIGGGCGAASQSPTNNAASFPSLPPVTTTAEASPSVAAPARTEAKRAPVATKAPKTATPTTKTSAPVQRAVAPAAAYYANCSAVKAAGKAPIKKGQPGYRSALDRDGDGTACDK